MASPVLRAAAHAAIFSLAITAFGASPWNPDRGDGTFANPVLFADYSDPDAIRVGEDYWLTSSSFNHVPGLPILHSRDLVNWELVNHALPQLVPVGHFRTVRHGEGVWAPAIRYRAGKFYIYYPDPDFGLYLVTATDPRGKWSEPALVKAGKGLIDPCPFWDDDGTLYLIHGWARSRGPISNRVSICRLSPDGTRTLDESVDVVDANKLPGWRTLEGPKLYKRAGYYYIFAPAGGVKEGYQAVFRSKQLYGPYENRIVLDQGPSPTNGPHQGAWVETPSGESWFLHFQDRGAFGRVVHLQPMVWRDDGWPGMGTAVTTTAVKGAPVLGGRKPSGPVSAVTTVPVTSDEFTAAELGLPWQWQANPLADWSTLSARPGWLRLTAAANHGDELYDAPHLLLQKFTGPRFTATTRLDGSALREGDEAGLIVFGYSYAWIGLRRNASGLNLVGVVNHIHDARFAATSPGRSQATSMSAPSATLLLRVRVDENASCTFSWSTDGTTFTPVLPGTNFEASADRWVGAKVGVFATRPSLQETTTGGYADFDWFKMEP